jgi:primary-amine oxidase
VIAGLPNDTLSADVFGPFSFNGDFRRLWVTWRHNTAGSFLQPVGFYQYADVSGTDPSQWKILKVYAFKLVVLCLVSYRSHKIVYNHQIFLSTESFLVAFHNGTLKRLPSRPGNSADLSWSSRKRVGPQLDLDHLPGPRSVSFAGLRFKVDRKLQYISWMGWGLYLGFDRDMGLSLWDIRMRNERIVYQVRLSSQNVIEVADIQIQILCSLHLRRR